MVLYEGRPQDISGRQDKEIKIYDFLDRLGVKYIRVDHPPAMTMSDCAEIDKIFGAGMCKNLFLCNRQKTEFYILMLSGNKQFKTKELSSQIGSARLSFADSGYMESLLDTTPSSVSVLSLLNDRNNKVKLLIDRDVLMSEYIGCHPCINTSSLKISVSDLLDKIIPATGHETVMVSL